MISVVRMHASIFVIFLLLVFALCLLIVAINIPDSSFPLLAPLSHHVFRLPIGSRRISHSKWRWENETVKGIFHVYSGYPPPLPKNKSQGFSAACCDDFGARLGSPIENYEVESANDGTFSSSVVMSTFSGAITTWENVAGNRFGSGSHVSSTSGIAYNNRNQVGLGTLDIDEPGALAVTAVWIACPSGGSLISCPTTLEIVEWDQSYDFDNFQWCVTGSPNCYDFLSVVVHELGHSLGLADLYTSSCVESTMYGYASKGETFRRSLDTYTISCVRELYGLSSDSLPLTSNFSCAFVFLVLVFFFFLDFKKRW